MAAYDIPTVSYDCGQFWDGKTVQTIYAYSHGIISMYFYVDERGVNDAIR